MPSSRSIGKLLTVLVVVLATLGFVRPSAPRLQPSAAEGGEMAVYQGAGKVPQVVKLLSARPRQQKESKTKRHKRLLISKAFHPAPTVIFLKRFRAAEPFSTYVSAHILQRTLAVASLRGPPLT